LPSILIESTKLLVDGELTTAHILLEDGMIKTISKTLPESTPEQKIDGSRLIALPGLIDAHVHLRDLQLSYKETFETGTQAAAAGGYTTVIDMPNSRPPTTNTSILLERMSKAEGRIYSNVGFQGALLEDGAELKRMAENGALAFKLYLNKTLETFDSADEANLTRAFEAAKQSNVLLTVHAEDGRTIEEMQRRSLEENRTGIKDFLKAHSSEVEVRAVRRVLGLSRKLGLKIHICHITIPEAVKLVRTTQGATCEASPHHLLLNQSIFKKQQTLGICVPPIRNNTYRVGLWRLFAEGQVDILASDHAPHTLEEKAKQNTWEAASGVPGLETSLPVLFTQVTRHKLSLRRFIDATSTIPARIFGLSRKGEIREGLDADIVLVDPKAKSVVKPEHFLSKAKYSPFKGMRCTGRAAFTIVNGTVVAEGGRIVGPAAGHVIKGGTTCGSS
jgi:dihydroorotase (multifunctional complex type)